ncbi:methyltransferase [Cryobacterium sp. GrIS_2_6]|uniref:Eco57I restriction-modification methylase domain-containing protein n=1 Tax=Cryobacterium sp. GrIS_2_6 TaxID=3162785 RepID=UPI002DFB6BEC|nr:methyltransferase [Cryobacterium psychrotolerans]MEC5149521.1 hypothetical protein [Cryobacterium psychrotolerans]
MTIPLSHSIVQLAISLGAADAGGPLTKAESELIAEASESPAPSAEVAFEARDQLLAGGDPLGKLFYALRDAAERRGSGTVYTPDEIVEPMVEWTLRQKPDRVVDAGCGSGRYTASLLRHNPAMPVIAIDLDPLATIMTRATVAVLAKADCLVVQGDFTRAQLPKFGGRTAFVGNPPYLRHHQLPAVSKAWAQKAAAILGHKVSGLAGLHVYFFLATGLLGKKGDVGCYVTSAEWLDVNYGSVVRSLLTETLGGEQIHVIDPEAEPFEGTQTTAAVTTFRIGSPVESIGFRTVPTLAALGALSDTGNPVAYARLVEASRWSTFIRTRTLVPEGSIELGELVRVHRGAVTGANAVWVSRGGSGLPESVLFPSITKARELFAAGSTLTTSDGLRDVIDIPTDLDLLDEAERKTIDKFLRGARKLSAHSGYVARNRKAWWAVGLRAPAPVLATYMARRPPAFVLNEVGARHINIAHGLYPRQELGETVLRNLALALNSSVVLGQGRTYSGGLTKFEPREMERLPIPNLATLRNYDAFTSAMGSNATID